VPYELQAGLWLEKRGDKVPFKQNKALFTKGDVSSRFFGQSYFSPEIAEFENHCAFLI